MHSLLKSGSIDRSALRVEFTAAARSVIAAGKKREGCQVVVLSWPAGAAYLPHEYYSPGEFDVVLAYVEGCPVYVDARRLALFTNRRIVLDADVSSPSHPHPPLRAHVVQPSRARTAVAKIAPQSGLVHKLVRELTPTFAAAFSESLIATYVRKAVSDLRGSVTADSLPEMAARLAHHRLSVIVMPQPDGTALPRVAAPTG